MSESNVSKRVMRVDQTIQELMDQKDCGFYYTRNGQHAEVMFFLSYEETLGNEHTVVGASDCCGSRVLCSWFSDGSINGPNGTPHEHDLVSWAQVSY